MATNTGPGGAKGNPKLPPNKGGITEVVPGPGGATPPPGPKPTPAEKKAAKKLQQQAENIAKNYQENNRGGAPVSPEFVLAALGQGLTPVQIRTILNSQALGGPQTGPSYSSTELLDYFTENPTELNGLYDAVVGVANGPANYAEYLAGGGVPGGYRAHNQLIQEAVLGIGGARDAYLSGTTRQRWIDEGNDPNQWAAHMYEVMNGTRDQQAGGGGPSFIGGFDVGQFDALATGDLNSLATATAQMAQARRRKDTAQSGYGDVFSIDQLAGGEQ